MIEFDPAFSTCFAEMRAEPAVEKVGPKGYIHGWIKVGPGDDGKIDKRFAQHIIDSTRKDGGYSVNLMTGKSPTSGFMVSDKDGGHVMDADEFYGPHGAEKLQKYASDHAEEFSQPDANLGTWHDTTSGKVFLDISHNVQDKDEAVRLGKANDQIAVWDVANQKEIPTGGTGGLEKAVAGVCPKCGLQRTKVSATHEFAKQLAREGKSFADLYGETSEQGE